MMSATGVTYMIENDNVESIIRANTVLIPLVLHDVHRAPARSIARLIRRRIVVAKTKQGLSYLRDTACPNNLAAALLLTKLSVGLMCFILDEGLYVELLPVVKVCKLEDRMMQAIFGVTVNSARLRESDGKVADLGMSAIGLLGTGSTAHIYVNSREELAAVYVAHVPDARIFRIAWYWL
jgi:hypothetical protein